MSEKKNELNTEAGQTGDIFTMNIFESDEPKLNENLPGANAPSTPERKNNDEASIVVPKTSDIPVSAYNDAIDNLQKVLKESAEALDLLKGLHPVAESVEDEQERFTESAIFESYCSGPYFEKADNADKEDIKEAVGKIKAKIKENQKDTYHLKPISLLGYLFGREASSGIQKKWKGILNPVMWQMTGVFFCNLTELTAALDHYKTKFAEDLGDLTFDAYRTNLTLMDIFGKATKGADGNAYILIVNTKRNKDVKAVELPTKADLAKEEKKEKTEEK